jgi:hypothetical protein
VVDRKKDGSTTTAGEAGRGMAKNMSGTKEGEFAAIWCAAI